MKAFSVCDKNDTDMISLATALDHGEEFQRDITEKQMFRDLFMSLTERWCANDGITNEDVAALVESTFTGTAKEMANKIEILIIGARLSLLAMKLS